MPATLKAKPTPRNVGQTRELFIAAVEKVLRKDGLQGLGINAIARAAGRDKVLIYKYFGSLEGLYTAFARSHPLFPTLEEMLGPAHDRLPSLSPSEIAKAAASGYIREIRKRPLTLEILRWELVVRNPLTEALSQVRGATTAEFIRLLGERRNPATPGSPRPVDIDIQALTSILYGGLVYLLLKADLGGPFNGLDLRKDGAWERLEKALHGLFERMLDRG